MRSLLYLFGLLVSWSAVAQSPELIIPDTINWNSIQENQRIQFLLVSTKADARFSLEATEDVGMTIDSVGNFSWKPSFDLVDRVEKSKQFNVIFQADWSSGEKVRKQINVTVFHVNRPPFMDELPAFYVRQNVPNTFQIPQEFSIDPDGDPLVYKAVASQMPEGATLSSQGLFSWTPSKSQFNSLRTSPLTLEFIVQDQPEKAESRGKIRIAQTQLDLPPELLIVPGDTLFTIKEDETLNLKIYLSDPNGDDNVRSAGFLSSDTRVHSNTLRENTSLQYEFTWMPGYDFVDDIQKTSTPQITFFTLDKSNNRTVKKIKVKVTDAENMQKKDTHLFQKYRSNLVDAYILIQQLDVNQKQLNKDYKKARKGKKHRSILNASLGAVTGLSPVVIDTPDDSKIVSGIGGTTVLTLGTLEATEVIGRSKEAIMDRIKNGIDIRNKVQAAGDEFARKYALKSARRSNEFDKDIEKLRAVLSDQRIVLLELDSYSRNPAKIDDKDVKKIFVDFAEEAR